MQNETTQLRHRHFVALPMLIAALAISIFDAQSTANILPKDEVITLSEGSKTIATEGLFRMKIADVDLTAFDGAFHISQNTEGTSIVALTSPVVIQSDDSQMIVPIGTQWTLPVKSLPTTSLPATQDELATWLTSRTPSRTPQHFAKKALEHAEVETSDQLLPALQSKLPIDAPLEKFLQLPEASERSDIARVEHLLGVFRGAVENGNLEDVQSLFMNADLQATLQTERGTEVVALLLSNLPTEESALKTLLLQTLLHNEDLRLLMLFHPAYHDSAWASHEGQGDQMLMTYLTPFTLLQDKGISDFAWKRYSSSLHDVVASAPNPAVFVEAMISTYAPLVPSLTEKGYPLRAQKLSTMLIDVSAAFSVEADVLTALQTEHIDLMEAVEEELEPLTQTEPQIALSEAELLARANAMLTNAGALFSVETSVIPSGPQTVAVKNILFASSTQDHMASFSLDVVTGTVNQIELNGETGFPYLSSFAKFVEWVRAK